MIKIFSSLLVGFGLLLLFSIVSISSCQTEHELLVPINIPKDSLSLGEVDFQIPEGFELEELFETIDSLEDSHGSWVSIAEGPDNTFFTCDQRGGI